MDIIQIRKVLPDDIEELVRISRQTFAETFAAANTGENMQKYLSENFSDTKLATELANPDSAFYFAIRENNVIGYLKLNEGQAQTEIKADDAVEIERIYVRKEYQGKKVGQLLVNKAVQLARAANARYLWLGVWEENTKAIAFYRKNGFLEFGRHIFRLGDDEQTDLMMKLRLTD